MRQIYLVTLSMNIDAQSVVYEYDVITIDTADDLITITSADSIVVNITQTAHQLENNYLFKFRGYGNTSRSWV